MNKIKTMMMSAVAICAASFTSCTDKMNWEVDPAFDRLFGITDITVTPDANSIAVEYKAPSGADRYEIQWSTDSLTDDNDNPEGVNVEITTANPDTIKGLMGDTYYFLRIRALSDSKKSSKWVYPIASNGKRSIHTLKEQIMFPVADENRGQDYITVTWNSQKEVTTLVVIGPDGPNEIVLPAEAKAAGSYTVTGLQPLTPYSFEIYNGAAMRGSCSASTTAAAPKGDFVYNMPETVKVLDNVIMKEIAESAKEKAADPNNYSATIVIPAGAKIDMVGTSESGEAASLKIPEGMSVTFFGAAGERPVITLSKSINLAGSHSFVRFQDLAIVEGGCQYIFNQADACSVEELSFSNVNFDKIDRCIVRVQGSNAVNIGSVLLDNCILSNFPDNYYAFDFRGSAQNIGKFALTNSTVYNVARFFQNPTNAIAGGVTVSDCTFNDIIANGRYFFDLNGQSTDLTIKNSIIGTLKAGARGGRTKGATNYENVYQTSDVLVPATEEASAAKFASNDLKIEIQSLSAADIFTAPADGNFQLKIGTKVGDPRWYMPAE